MVLVAALATPHNAGVNLDLDRYAERVGLGALPAPSIDGLHQLHRAQALAIPFENFDVLLGRPVRLDLGSLETKLVQRRRGGYCFELNGLLLGVLLAQGYSVTPLLGRVYYQRNPEDGVRPRTHQISRVSVGGRDFLVDVGFGSPTPRAPLRFELGLEQDLEGEVFRLSDAGLLGTQLEHRGPEGWTLLYTFEAQRAHPADYELSNHYTQTHPASSFRQGPRVARLLERGMRTMSALKVVEGSQEMPTPRGEALLSLLRERFGIELDQAPVW